MKVATRRSLRLTRRGSAAIASNEIRNWFLFFGVICPAATLYGAALFMHYVLTKNRRGDAT